MGIEDMQKPPVQNEEGPQPMTVTHAELFRSSLESPDLFVTEFPLHGCPYKTASEKLGYTKRLVTEIQPFIRAYFQRHKAEMLRAIQGETTAEYTENTKKAWEKHLKANAAIDCFLNYELGNVMGDWSPEEWKIAKKLLVAGMGTDHVKAMYSGGIKDKLELEIKKIEEKYTDTQSGFNADFEDRLLTPSFMSFPIARPLAHRKYKLSVLRGHPDEDMKQDITNRYYGGDVQMFEIRDRELKLSDDPSELKKDIETAERRAQKNLEAKQAFMARRSDVRALEDLLYFDNVTEYEYTYALKGLPDLFLREEVLRRLVEENLIAKDVSVFSLTAEDFISAIDTIIETLDKKFEIRLRQYRQTDDTCGTSCVMSILNRKGLPLNETEEMAIWEQVGRPYNFPGGLASVLLRWGFNVDFFQNSPELLSKDNPEFTSNSPELIEAAQNYVRLHTEAVGQGLHFEQKNFDFNTAMAEIQRGNACIIYIHVTEEVSHCILAHGYKNGKLLISDPLNSIKSLSEKEFAQRIQTPMGKRALVVKKLPNDLFDTLNERLQEIGY